MALTVYWTQFAENKLEDVFVYYSQTANIRTASRLVDRIIARSLELEKNPFMGQKETLLSGRLQEFRYLVYKNYKLIYWINEEKRRIEILNLFDCRQNPEKINEI